MEIFDYDKQIITYNGKSYPFVVINEAQTGIDHIISTHDLDAQLYDAEKGLYPSNLAEWIDEQITYFVSTAKDLLRPADEILNEIYK